VCEQQWNPISSFVAVRSVAAELNLPSADADRSDRLKRMAIDAHDRRGSILIRVSVESAHIPVRTDETGWIEDPAFNQGLEFGQFPWIEITCSAQSMQVAIGIETKLRWVVITACQFLTCITERLEVANGLRVLKRCHLW